MRWQRELEANEVELSEMPQTPTTETTETHLEVSIGGFSGFCSTLQGIWKFKLPSAHGGKSEFPK